MLLTVTQAGHKREQEALATGTAVAKLDKLLVGAGPIQDAPHLATSIKSWYEAPILTVERLSSGALKLTAEVPAEVEGWIRDIGLVMADGTLYAYAPYQVESNGLFKGMGFAFSFYVVISREGAGELEVNYAPLDVDALAEQIAIEATKKINANIDASLYQILIHLSSLNREALNYQDKLNTLEAQHNV